MGDYEEEDIKYGPPGSRKDEYKALPKFNEEKPMIGPKIDGQIKVVYKSFIEGFSNHDDEFAKMEALGLPTGFQFGNMSSDCGRSASNLKTKKQKKTYYCYVCKIELNSEDTLISHMKGTRHMKKALAQTEGGHPVVQQIENPAPTRKKVCIRLQQKIRETNHKIVGLTFIKEFIACSNSEMEPHYECHLCETKGMSNCMYSHLLGQQHRQNYVDHYSNQDPHMMNLSQAELLRFATEHDENRPGLEELIETRFSDDEYPWPDGMEPWLLENGGSGIIPDGARNNYGKTKPKPTMMYTSLKMEFKPDVKRINLSSTFELASMKGLRSPCSSQEAMKAFEVGKQLLLASSEKLSMKSELRTLMKTVLKTADFSLKGILETSGSTGYPSTSSTRSPSLNSSWSHDDELRFDSQRARSKSRSCRARSKSRSYRSRSKSRSRSRSYRARSKSRSSKARSRSRSSKARSRSRSLNRERTRKHEEMNGGHGCYRSLEGESYKRIQGFDNRRGRGNMKK